LKRDKRTVKRHLFICANEKPMGESCGPKDSQMLINSLKIKLRENDLWDDFKVTKTGCLGPCEEGISALMFPENEMLTGLRLSDEEKLYKMLTSAE
jgi:predicted metal-binding protein